MANATTILIVDDSRTVRASLKKMLNGRFNVLEGEDGENGWSQLQQNPDVNLIISDIMMPNLDGYGLICRVRGCGEKFANVPIVVITSKEDEITRERAHACGANNFIVKPIESSDLIETVEFHTEANLSKNPNLRKEMSHYEQHIENAVMEAPDLNTAMDMLKDASGSLEPYAVDLALKMIPLLRYCDEKFRMGITEDIEKLKASLQKAV
ncbi:MAG: response regulator [Gammaproteobacteria bacterium]|nr:response regulator [Gammaproteobacteria bacterium]MDH5802351.1 response regulator [Gammaproteobacteria bacterium]